MKLALLFIILLFSENIEASKPHEKMQDIVLSASAGTFYFTAGRVFESASFLASLSGMIFKESSNECFLFSDLCSSIAKYGYCQWIRELSSSRRIIPSHISWHQNKKLLSTQVPYYATHKVLLGRAILP